MVSIFVAAIAILSTSKMAKGLGTAVLGVTIWGWKEAARKHRIGVNPAVDNRFEEKKTKVEELGEHPAIKQILLAKLEESRLLNSTFSKFVLDVDQLPRKLQFLPEELILTQIESERLMADIHRYMLLCGEGEKARKFEEVCKEYNIPVEELGPVVASFEPDPILSLEELVLYSNERLKDWRVRLELSLQEQLAG